MIITRLIGGIGNQLFQYAAARAVAHYNHMHLKLYVSAFGLRLPWITKILAIFSRRIPGVIFRRLLRIGLALPRRIGRVLESRQSNHSRR